MKPAEALAALRTKKAQLKYREKLLKAELEAHLATESRKLRLAIGSYMVGHLADPAIRRSLNKVLPGLRPDLRGKLTALLAGAIGSNSAQDVISWGEAVRSTAETLPGND